jgi:uncharacterized protein (TIGR03000 family)
MQPAGSAPISRKADLPEGSTHAVAKVIVELPSDAKLYVNDQLTTTTSERRVFNTPLLEEGEGYYYLVRAEVMRAGQNVSRTKKVFVRAGDVVQTTFPELQPPSTVASVER